jgi:arylsulfatase A-like enzyme
LASGPRTLAEVLRSQGYQTAGFASNLLYMQKGWGIAQGFQQYGDDSISLWHNLAGTLLGNAVIQPVYARLNRFDYFDRVNAAELNNRIFRWFRHGTGRPYFLFVNYFDVHDPYFAPKPYNRHFGEVSSTLARRLFSFTRTANLSTSFSPRARNSLIAGYDNCLAYLDHEVETLLKFLRRSRDLRNTIIIITSDHGEEFGWQGSYEHGRNLSRGVLHVPLIMAGAGIPKGLRISHMVGTRQLFSTILDLAGHGKTPFNRTSLARFWNPGFKPTSDDDTVVSELVPASDLEARRVMISLATPKWQYIAHRDGRQELYNWLADPQERVNLAGSPKEQGALDRVRSHLVDLVSNATGPWLGMAYLGALDGVAGPARLSLLHPKPLLPDSPDSKFRIGDAQAFFKPDKAMPTRPSQSERELMRSLPYQ